MQLMFLGTGSAFSTERFQSNVLLETNGKRLLIDAGGTIHQALKSANVPLHSLDGVYVSHLHADHWGGSEYLALSSYYSSLFLVEGARRKLKLFAHPTVRAGAWNKLESAVLADKKAELSDFFDVQDHEGESFQWEGVTFEMIQALHSIDNGQPLPCFGLHWQTTDSKRYIWFSADATLDEKQILFEKADVIFHDCETSPFTTTVHATYAELLQLPEVIRKKITLFHYNDGTKADAVADGFAGWAEQGLVIEL